MLEKDKSNKVQASQASWMVMFACQAQLKCPTNRKKLKMRMKIERPPQSLATLETEDGDRSSDWDLETMWYKLLAI